MLLSVFMIGLVFIAVLAAGAVLVAIAALVELLPSRARQGPDELDRDERRNSALERLHRAAARLHGKLRGGSQTAA